jgi:hypothetical protein
VKKYFADDSIFILAGLFDGKLQHRFKIEQDQWFMKYDSDRKVFFSQNEYRCGSWNLDGVDMIAQWQKTDITDNADTVYKFEIVPLYNSENPLRLENGTEKIYVQADTINPYYFTCSSGIIAFNNPWIGLFIREDKMYLKEILMKDILGR